MEQPRGKVLIVDASKEAAANTSRRSQAAGFSGLLGKPFDLEELLRLVRHAVTRPAVPVASLENGRFSSSLVSRRDMDTASAE